jgi:putative ABC transport system permease protein
LDILLHDLRYALRIMLRRPGFTTLVVLTLALGIGANTAIFSVVNAVLLSQLPFKDPERLVSLGEINPGWSTTLASSHAFVEWKRRNKVFEKLATMVWWDANLESGTEPQSVISANVSSSYFDLLGMQPLLGRTFLPEECVRGSRKVVILGHAIWQQLGAPREIVGQTLRINGESYTVVGVMTPLSYHGPFVGLGDLWMPSQLDEQAALANPSGWRGFRVLGRLKPGISLETARAEMEAIESQLAREFPKLYSGYSVLLRPLHEFVVGETRPALLMLLVAVGFMLLIACANLANLLLAKAVAREKEVAIRMALGAGRRKIIRQLLTESILLSLLGAAVGLLLAYGGIRLLTHHYFENIPLVGQSNLGERVLFFTLMLSLLTGVLFGLAPALGATRTDLNGTIKEGGQSGMGGVRHNRIRDLLIVFEVAMAMVLLIGSGLMLKSLWNLSTVDAGFQRNNILTFDLSLPGSRYNEAQSRVTFFRRLLSRLETLPGVSAAGANRYFPLRDRQFSNPIYLEGQPVPEGQESVVQYGGITSGYFRALGIPVIKGRDFTEQEMWETGGAVVINERMARLLWPNQDPLGKRIKYGPQENWLTIVGVVSDVRQRRLDIEPYPQIYVPYADYKHTTMTFAVHTTTNPTGLISAVRREVLAQDSGLPLFNVMTLNQAVEHTTAGRRLTTLLLGSFATLALILAAVGIYGVLSYTVSQRAHEIGIRLALGAQPKDVLKLVVGNGLKLALLGLVIGSALALLLTNLMSSLLFGVTSRDPITFVLVAAFLFIVTLFACYLPARRASRIDPMIAIRYK